MRRNARPSTPSAELAAAAQALRDALHVDGTVPGRGTGRLVADARQAVRQAVDAAWQAQAARVRR